MPLFIFLNAHAGSQTQSPSVPSTMMVYNVTHLDFDPSNQDIFGYLEDFRRDLARLNDLNERIPEAELLFVSETYIRSKLTGAARQFPVFKAVIDHIIIQPVEVWSKIKVDDLVKQLEAAKANDASLQSKRYSPSHVSSSSEDQVQANPFSAKKGKDNKQGQNNKETRTCFAFQKTGKCSKAGCQYLHSAEVPSQTKARRATQSLGDAIKALESQPKRPLSKARSTLQMW